MRPIYQTTPRDRRIIRQLEAKPRFRKPRKAKFRRVLVAGVVFMLPGCAALQSEPVQTAATVVDAACQLGLLQSALTERSAQKLAVDKGLLSQVICSIPELVDAFRQAKMARSADPAEPVLRKAGVL